MTFSQLLRAELWRRHWTVTDLARHCQDIISLSQASEYVAGEHTPRRLKAEQICERLGIELPAHYEPRNRWTSHWENELIPAT
jgi:hypothetical protein